MTDEKQIPIEYELIRDGSLLEELEVIESNITPTVGDEDLHVRLQLRVGDDEVEWSAFPLIYTLAALSFHDARPRGASGKWFEDDDQFTAADMIRHLRFERGRLHMYVDYLRGRCMKTTIEVSPDGTIMLDTVNRGQAATRWVDRLKGKKFLQALASE